MVFIRPKNNKGIPATSWGVETVSLRGVCVCVKIKFWLVVEPTHLKNIRQIGSSSQVGGKNEKIFETTT